MVVISFGFAGTAVAGPNPIEDSRQILVVTTGSWSATSGSATFFERNQELWQPKETGIPVVLGKAGLAWGRGCGFCDLKTVAGPVKREGDNKSPAGVFRLRLVFGRASKNPGTRMPYLPLTKNIVAVDDPRSRHYNTLVDESKVETRDWHSAEQMILSDHRYDWGITVEHNVPPVPGAGSCIFLHVWKNRLPTAGCTAMAESNLLDIIRRLDPDRVPLLVQMPRPVYGRLRQNCNLPAL